LADTDLDKISEARSMNIIKQDEQLKGDEDENSSDCIKQPVNSQNGTGLSTGTNEVEGEREVGSEQVSDSNSRETQMVPKLILTLPAQCHATMAIRELLKTSTSVCIPSKVFF
jgi:tRNA pseudouridine13 synthase